MRYDLCLPWYWEYDDVFAGMVERACIMEGVSLWQVTPENLLESITALYRGVTTFETLLNRGQGESTFEPIERWAREHGARRINPSELSAWSEDKATMHLEFISAGLNTPHTILLPSFLEQPVLPPVDLSPLGGSFVIKPSNGGGGEGVILGASSMEQALRARMEFPTQKYLLQSHIAPRLLGGRPAWFRVFYAAGEIFPCWWATDTHVYQVLSAFEEAEFGLQELRELTRRIAAICKLDWFSTEIALADDFIVVDYVNDEIDTRVQSQAADGVPDEVVNNIARQLVKIAKENIRDERAF
jgi:glutathione synthase/RimK-type ligase-like ATP-grasp enzyme